MAGAYQPKEFDSWYLVTTQISDTLDYTAETTDANPDLNQANPGTGALAERCSALGAGVGLSSEKDSGFDQAAGLDEMLGEGLGLIKDRKDFEEFGLEN